jgi:hypothetical protein
MRQPSEKKLEARLRPKLSPASLPVPATETMLTFIFNKLGWDTFAMRRAFLAVPLALVAGLATFPAAASNRSFVYTQESRVLTPGESELEPWTTFHVGRSQYYNGIDARLELEHGLAPGLQLALYWNFGTKTQDVRDELTGELSRVSSSEFESVSAELKYQLTDPTADMLGSALYLETTLGPSESELEGKLILDRALGNWLFAANLVGELELEPIREDEGSELETALVLEPVLAAAYALPHVSIGLELRAPIGVAGEAESATLFGGPVVRWSDRGFWAALGVQPQLAAFSGKSAGSRLDLNDHERLEVRLLAGFML